MTSMNDEALASPPPPPPKPSSAGWRPRLLALGVSLLFAALLAELALRIMGVGYGHAPIVGHPVYHHWHPGDYQMRVWSHPAEFGGFNASFNSQGMSGKAELPPPGTPSIVFLGDSFTEALQVPEDRRYVAQVASALGLAPVNLGCSSFTPLLSRLNLETFADRLSPAVVVLQIFSNDVGDDVELRKHATVDGAGRVTAAPGEQTSLSVRLARQSYLARLIRKTTLTIAHTREMSQRSGGSWQAVPWPSSFTRPMDEWFSPPERQGFETSVSEIRDLCKARGWPLVVWAVPDRGAVLRGERDWYYEYQQALAARLGIPFIDVAKAFPQERLRELFFGFDIHFNERGHAAVAELLAREIKPFVRR